MIQKFSRCEARLEYFDFKFEPLGGCLCKQSYYHMYVGYTYIYCVYMYIYSIHNYGQEIRMYYIYMKKLYLWHYMYFASSSCRTKHRLWKTSRLPHAARQKSSFCTKGRANLTSQLKQFRTSLSENPQKIDRC